MLKSLNIVLNTTNLSLKSHIILPQIIWQWKPVNITVQEKHNRNDITDILLKVALNTIKPNQTKPKGIAKNIFPNNFNIRKQVD